MNVPVMSAKYQALAQMVAVRERVVTFYCAKYPLLSQAQVMAVYDKYPSYGVVSSGEHWFVLKYFKSVHGLWEAEQSEMLTFKCTYPKTKTERKVLRKDIEQLLKYLSGASKLVYQQVLELEQALEEMNSAK